MEGKKINEVFDNWNPQLVVPGCRDSSGYQLSDGVVQ